MKLLMIAFFELFFWIIKIKLKINNKFFKNIKKKKYIIIYYLLNNLKKLFSKTNIKQFWKK